MPTSPPPSPDLSGAPPASKDAWRRRIRAGRASRPAARRRAAADGLIRLAPDVAVLARRARGGPPASDPATPDGRAAPRSPDAGRRPVIAAYTPAADEPGDLRWLDALRRYAHVLLPVVPGGPPTSLQWGVYRGAESLERGRFGIAQPRLTLPDAPEHRHPAIGLDRADLVLVPALAVDLAGRRLGQGAGYYDRSLPGADPRAALLAVVFDDELVEVLPSDRHDSPVHGALTPSGLRNFADDREMRLRR